MSQAFAIDASASVDFDAADAPFTYTWSLTNDGDAVPINTVAPTDGQRTLTDGST